MFNWGLIFISNFFIIFSNISVRSYQLAETDMSVIDLHTIRNIAQKDMFLMTDNAGLSVGIKNFMPSMASCGFVFIFNSSLYIHSI
jgi:hypothetical protein